MKTLTIILLTLLFGACQQNDKKEAIAECHKKEDEKHHAGMNADQPSGHSLYLLSSEWTSQLGEKVTLQDLQGKKVVVSMVYTSCQYACPAIAADMLKIEKKMSSGQLKDTRFVLVTFDTRRDTPAQLKDYADKLGLDHERWLLLNGNDGDVMELAAVLGIKYKKTSDIDYSHSNIISLLNEKGEIIFQQEGLGNAPDKLVSALKHSGSI